MKKKNILVGFLIFAVLTSTLTNLSDALNNFKVEGLDPITLRLVTLLKYLFESSAMAFAVGYLRNLLGFLENYFRARYTQSEINYELEKLGETWAKYQAEVLAISSWLPPPIAAATTFILDLATSSIRKLRRS